MAEPESQEKSKMLIELAENVFGVLTQAEKKLLQKVVVGETANFCTGNPEKDDPKRAKDWGKERIIRAKVIEWICTDKQAVYFVTYQGIQVMGVRIDGELDLSFVEIPFPLGFIGCHFSGNFYLMHSILKLLNLLGSHLQSLIADGVEVKGEVFLCEGFKAEGEVGLRRARIEGNLDCHKGDFKNPRGYALNADGIEVTGSIFLRENFKAEGEVRLPRAQIGVDLDCSKGYFENSGEKALHAEGVRVGGNILLSDGFEAEREVKLLGAKVGGKLVCCRGYFKNPAKKAIVADGIEVNGSVSLSDGFKAEGEVRLPGARIGGDLDCSDGYFRNPEGRALSADKIEVNGAVNLRNNFMAEGEVRLLEAKIGKTLDCSNGFFRNSGGKALNADGTRVNGGIFLREGFKAEGEVRILGAKIEEDLDCSTGYFKNPKGYALNAEGAEIKGCIFLREGFEAEGKLSFVEVRVKKFFCWWNVRNPERVELDLRYAQIKSLDDRGDYPPQGKLLLSGLVYEYFSDGAPKDVDSRLNWLRRQPEGSFSPQPYEQLAFVYQKSGKYDEARKILLEKEREITKRLKGATRIFRYFLGFMVGYGYQPVRLLGWTLGIIILWGLIYGVGLRWEWLRFTQGLARFGLHSHWWAGFLYSLDIFIPLVELGVRKYIMVINPLMWILIVFQTVAGWLFTALLIHAIIRRLRW